MSYFPFSTFFTFLFKLALSCSYFSSCDAPIPSEAWTVFANLKPDYVEFWGWYNCMLLKSFDLFDDLSFYLNWSYFFAKWMNNKFKNIQYFVIFLISTSLNWVKISIRLTKLLVILSKLENTSRNPKVSKTTPIAIYTLFLT